MLVLVIVLAVLVLTNVATAAGLLILLRRSTHHPEPDARLAAVLDGAPAPMASSSAARRVISVEILNAVELAGTRGRWAGVAGSLAPGLVKRIVHDQTIKILRRQLSAEGVRADVRLHVVPPAVASRRAPIDCKGNGVATGDPHAGAPRAT